MSKKKSLKLADIKLNISWIKRKAEIQEITFKEEVAKFAEIVKETGCKAYNLNPKIQSIENLYNNYNALLAVTEMIEKRS